MVALVLSSTDAVTADIKHQHKFIQPLDCLEHGRHCAAQHAVVATQSSSAGDLDLLVIEMSWDTCGRTLLTQMSSIAVGPVKILPLGSLFNPQVSSCFCAASTRSPWGSCRSVTTESFINSLLPPSHPRVPVSFPEDPQVRQGWPAATAHMDSSTTRWQNTVRHHTALRNLLEHRL